MPVPDFSVGEVFTAEAADSIGIWRITSGITATNGTVSDGVVTIGNAVGSVTVTGAFSSTFENYLILISGGVSSASCFLQMRLGSTTTNYWNSLIYANWTNTLFNPVGNKTGGYWTYAASGEPNGLFGEIYLSSPFAAKRTMIRSTYISQDTGYFTGMLDNTTSYSSFSLTPNTGTLTGGTIRVYGYRN